MSGELKILRTGALYLDEGQPDPSACLGGKRAADAVESLRAIRLTPITNLEIEEIGGNCAPGMARLSVNGSGKIIFAAPDDDPGDATTAALNTSTVITSDDSDQWIRVKRTGVVYGSEVLQLVETVNNAVGGADFSSAERTAGTSKYSAINLYNASAGTITALKIWIDADTTANVTIDTEAESSSAIQTIASDTTAPSGRTFAGPTTEGTAETVASLAAGAGVGLWIKRSVSDSDAATPFEAVVLNYKYTYGGSDYTGQIRGAFRIADQTSAQYELYLESTTPDPSSHTAKATGSSFPLTYESSLSDGTYYANTYQRNEYGMLSPAGAVETIIISSGEQEPAPPSAPSQVSIQTKDGAAVLDAVYFPGNEASASLSATHWLVYKSDDGTDALLATPEVIAMTGRGGREQLHKTYTVDYDNTPVSVVVRTRRVDTATTDSTNEEAVSVNTADYGPSRTVGAVNQGRTYGLSKDPETPPDETVYIDETNNIRWVLAAGSVSLYGDTDLIWRCVHTGDPETSCLYIPSDFAYEVAAAQTETFETDAAVHVGDGWGTTSILYIPVQKTAALKIDVTNSKIYSVGIDTTEEVPAVYEEDPGAQRYNETFFTVWNPATQEYTPYISINSDGNIVYDIGLDITLSQAAIEAL